MANFASEGVHSQLPPKTPSQTKASSLPTTPSSTHRRTMMGTQPAAAVAPLSMYAEHHMIPSIPNSAGNRTPPYNRNSAMQPATSATSPRTSASLMAFDPLLSGSGRPPSAAAASGVSPHLSPQQQQKSHHRSAQSMNAGDLRAMAQGFLHNQQQQNQNQQIPSQEHNNSNNKSNNSSRGNSPNPPPPAAGSNKQAMARMSSPQTKSPPRTRMMGSKMFGKKKQHQRAVSVGAASATSPVNTAKTTTTAASANVEQGSRASLPNSPKSLNSSSGGGAAAAPSSTNSSSNKSSMYPGIVSDLMELKLNKLELPSLAKPSPTSFLTGKDDEVVRTSEAEAAPFQMEIPPLQECLVIARLNEFVDHYRNMDQNFDLEQWVGVSRMDLQQVHIPQHVPIAQSILECGDDVSLRGVVTKGSASPDERLEVAVFEGQRQFLAVFRGTTDQQTKGISSKSKKKAAVPLDEEHKNVEVYSMFLEEYMKLEAECFAILDKLTDEEPFCDVVFSGHSFGGAMATLAAYRYANARPMVRVACVTFASPKAGFAMFRQMINSQPNLKMIRLELGQDGKCQLPGASGAHAGHTLVLHGSLGSNSQKVVDIGPFVITPLVL
eukprot:scaffold584_cov132-Cylindrotheca_fusiformis.AAC.3